MVLNFKLKAAVIISAAILAAPLLVQGDAPPVVYISQIQVTGGKGSANDDFIELFNPNGSAVDLKGLRLVKRAQNSRKDESIKSWTKSAVIPPKSFFLWANSGYADIAAKPDSTTSATLAADNGVALLGGSSAAPTLIDSAAWGKADNGFLSVSASNPGPGQALLRQNLSSRAGGFAIAAAAPRNSSETDLQAAFAASQVSDQAPAASQAPPAAVLSGKTAAQPSESVPAPAAVSPPAAAAAPAEPPAAGGMVSNTPSSELSQKPPVVAAPANNTKAKLYLSLAIISFLILVLLVYFYRRPGRRK